ncbi:hypothetical protein [Streptomyces sp. NPDC048277]|uniref:hypothetical protein n=1 Tax=Streptomyces sp. NPDC048277 TaxID=3155027 RepID=UPI0033ECAB43
MHRTQHHTVSRALAAGALSLAVLSAGTAGAFAAPPKPSPTPTMTSPKPGMASPKPGNASPKPGMTSPKPGHASPKPTPPMSGMGSITARASKASVMTGEPVTFTGRTSGLKVGSPLVLQHEVRGKWVPLKANAKVKNGSSYALTTSFRTKGTEHVRVAAVGKKVYSPTVTVDVT